MMNYTLAKLHKPKTGHDWYVYFTYRDPQTGQMILFKERNGINRLKSVAEKKHKGGLMVSAINEQLKNGWSPLPNIEPEEEKDDRTLQQVLKSIWQVKEPILRKRSVEHYKYVLDLMKEYLKDRPNILPGEFTPAMAQGYSDFLILTKRYTPGTHNNHLSFIKTYFNAIVDKDIIDKNPFKKIKNKPTEEGRSTYYKKEQKDLIRDYTKAKDHPMYLFIQWIYFCFLRPKEIMGMKVANIDFENHTIFVPSNIAKNRKNGLVPISDDFMPIVKERYEHLDPECYLFGKKQFRPGLLPSTRNRSSMLYKSLRETLKMSSEYECYDWKHTGARNFIISGRNPVDLMNMMRHHSLDETMRYCRSLGVAPGMKIDPEAWKF